MRCRQRLLNRRKARAKVIETSELRGQSILALYLGDHVAFLTCCALGMGRKEYRLVVLLKFPSNEVVALLMALRVLEAVRPVVHVVDLTRACRWWK